MVPISLLLCCNWVPTHLTLYTYYVHNISATLVCVYYPCLMVQTAAHTKAAGTEEVLRRMEKELREKLKAEKTENQSLTQKVHNYTYYMLH